MDITNINLGTCPPQYLSIGYVGETGARPVAFDFSAWATEYGAGVLQLLLQRPGDADPYPVVLDIDGTTATWTPNTTATEKTGQGQAQLIYTVGGVVVKNAIFRVLIAPSLGAAGDPPEPYEDWLQRLLTIAAEAQQSAIDAAGSAEAAGTSAGAAAGSAGAAAQSALDAEAAKTGAETAEQTAQQAAALARAKAAEAAEAGQIAGENADYAMHQSTMAADSAAAAYDSAESAAQSADDAQAAAAVAQTAATAAGASADSAEAAADEVETKGAEQITAINQAGTTQIAAVDAAGAVQVQAIEDKGEEVLESIPEDYSDLSADVVDLKSAVNEYTEELFTKSVKDISNNSYTAQIISNLWSRSGRCAIVSVPSDVIKISVTANSSLSTDIAFLTSNAHNGNTAPNYVAGTSVITISAGKTYTSVKPIGCTYMYILKSKTDGGSDRVPAEIGFYTLKDVLLLDQSLTISGDAADAKATGDSIRELQDRLLYTADEKDISGNNYTAMISNGAWVRNGRCAIIPVPDDIVKIRVTANDLLSTDIAFLTSNAHAGGTTPNYVSGTGIISISTGISQLLQKPESCTYLYILKSTTEGGEDRVPSKIVFYAYKEQSATFIPLGLHEMPRDTNALNIVKRCRQMTDIKWTPAVDLPRYMLVQRGNNIPDSAEPQNYLGTFKAGVEYTGVPYGRVTSTMTSYGYSYATVGRYIGFETFISAVEDPNSIIPTSHVGSVSNHRSIMYATVCSGMTCYALNVPEVPTARIPQIAGLQLIGKINNNGTLLADNEFEIGDVLNKYDYHTAIITDIIRNADGEIVLVELSDASTAGLADKNYSDGQIGGICRRKGWTRSQLFDASSWGDYSLYRYSGTVTYTSNPYVNVGDEFNMQRIEHFPCMPYEGNKFKYKTGYIPNNAVKILVSLSDYGYLKVFKDGTEINGSPFVVTDDTSSINVSEIGAGTYTAYLCNITDGNVVNLTYPCEWTIE